MSYQIFIKTSAEKELEHLPRRIFDRIVESIIALENEPRPKGCKKLRGEDKYRLRIGEYRILYSIDDPNKTIEIFAIGHRKDVYR